MTARKQIAFIKQGGFSHINAAVETILAGAFPEHELLVVDVAGEYLCRLPVRWMSRLQVWRHYGTDLLARRRTYWDCSFRTPWMHHAIRQWLARRLAPHRQRMAFSFQTQSLFDASTPDLAHFVYTDHTHLANLTYPAFDRRRLFPAHWVTLETETYRHARMVFAMSRHVERSLVGDYGCAPTRVRCVFAGSNAAADPAPPDPGRYASKRILFNGLDWERKGGPELAAAFQQVLAQHPDARLVVLGCSPRLSVPNCVVLGRVPLEAVPRHYREASIFCLPTRIEPFGIVFVEAMHHALPIISTRLGALPDMVRDGHNGWLVPPGDTAALAAALAKLLDSPAACRELGENGRALARADYTWEAVGRRLGEAIRQALADGGKH